MQNEGDKLLSAAQVAERLGLATGTIRNFRCRGRLPEAIKIGATAVRWRESDILKIVRGETSIPAAGAEKREKRPR